MSVCCCGAVKPKSALIVGKPLRGGTFIGPGVPNGSLACAVGGGGSDEVVCDNVLLVS